MNDFDYKPDLKDALRSLHLPVFVAQHSALSAMAANDGWSYDRFLHELCRLELDSATSGDGKSY